MFKHERCVDTVSQQLLFKKNPAVIFKDQMAHESERSVEQELSGSDQGPLKRRELHTDY